MLALPMGSSNRLIKSPETPTLYNRLRWARRATPAPLWLEKARTDSWRIAMLNKLSLKMKLVAGFGLLLAILVALGIASYHTAQHVASASEELSASSQQISANSEETSAQAGTVSQATQHVSENLQSVSTGAEEMTSTIQSIASNAHEAATVAS